MKYSKNTMTIIKKIQKNEYEASLIYANLANRQIGNNAEILGKISRDEMSHYETFKKFSEVELKPNLFRVNLFIFISYIFGITFTMKLLENLEKDSVDYEALVDEIPEIQEIIDDEELHEQLLISMIGEKRLEYMSSVVLGLNDALVELTGALAGFTLSIQNSSTIALLGLITGISASLSMASSEYLSNKAEGSAKKEALISAMYTGLAYIFTLILLVTPYFLIDNYLLALGLTVVIAILIIAIFNYYMAVCNDDNFKSRFIEMASISISVALISFIIGYVVKVYFGLDI